MTSPTPVVSVVVATLNEERRIGDFLDGVLSQDLREPIEVLVVDGGSTDSTRGIVAERSAQDGRVRLLHNEHRVAPAAFNIGIREARSENVALLGAHCRYPNNYLRACLAVVAAAEGPTACGGLIETVPASDLVQARLSAAVAGSSFASSARSFRTQTAGEVEGIPYPIYRRVDLVAVGGFDERLVRNQDNDLSERLRRSGVRLVVTDETTCEYVAREDIASLLRHAHLTGLWNGRTVRLGVNALKVRHFVPAAFVTVLAGSALIGTVSRGFFGRIGRWGFAGSIAAHLLVGAKDAFLPSPVLHGMERAALPPVILAFHVCYGGGTLRGLLGSSHHAESP